MEHGLVAVIIAIVQFVIAPVAVPYLKRRLTPKHYRTRTH
jgi:hypothetical protein